MIGTRQIPKIAKLPRQVLRQLVKRLESAHLHDYTFTDHETWLTEKGYKISRSQVHRFCQELKELKASNPDGEDILALYLNGLERSRIYL
jgi:hypothetical protein